MGYGGGLARALGWFSVGLGAVQIVAPRRFAEAIGIDDDKGRRLVRLVGAREIAVGLGLLAEPRPVRWLQARVVGDAMDAAILGRALASDGADRSRTAMALAAVSGIAVLDAYGAVRTSRRSGPSLGGAWRERALDVTQSITINRPAEETYRFWRKLENLPRFMQHLQDVEDLGGGRSRWRVRAPAGMQVAWDAEIVDERPGEWIAWRSLANAQVDNEGWVRFAPAPGGRGTEVTVRLRYTPPVGRIGAVVARLFGEAPSQQVRDDLRAFKQIMEIGEVVRSDASVHRRPHPAQPSERKMRASEDAGADRTTEALR